MSDANFSKRFLVHWAAGYPDENGSYQDSKEVHTLKNIIETFNISHYEDIMEKLLANEKVILCEMAEEIIFTPLD